MKQNVSNPLAAPQREKDGSSTFNKYEYQYHWALCKIVSLHEESAEYVVFVEYHEDVIVADSLSAEDAHFEFNQIKNFKGSPWTGARITKRPKKGGKLTPSVLGKLISGVKSKPFFEKLKALNLVNTTGYTLDIADQGLDLSIISVGDLSPDGLQGISDAMLSELGSGDIPHFLNFILSDLAVASFDHISVGLIARLLEKKYPLVNAKALSIYYALMDDLRRKGMMAFDFTKWNDCVKNKGLTSFNFEEVIEQYSDRSIASVEKDNMVAILGFLKVPSSRSMKMMMDFKRYYGLLKFQVNLPLTVAVEKVEHVIAEFVSGPDFELVNFGIDPFLDYVEGLLASDVMESFPDKETLRVSIVHELSKQIL